MAGEDTQKDSGIEPQPGGGYIPPDSALTSTGLSAGFSGTTSFAGLALMTLAWNVGPIGGGNGGGGGIGTPQNVPLAAGLMLAAIAFAGLALLITALAGREQGYRIESSIALLGAYVALSLFGLVADALGLVFLALDAFRSFRLAAIVGTLLQILALGVGIYSRLLVARKERKSAQRLPEGSLRRSPVVD